MEFQGRTWTFAIRKVGQSMITAEKEMSMRRQVDRAKKSRDRGDMRGRIIPVYTLCRRLMCEQCDRLEAPECVIPAT